MSGQGDGAYSDRWENMWKAGIQPGQAFDAECCSPSLQELFSSQLGNLEGKKVFIPGCGRGYDVVAFAKAGAKEVVGLELAPTAASVASEFVAQHIPIKGAEETQGGQASVQQGDFFAWKGEYDIGYDYTFFCALHPDMRKDWAAAWKGLLKPGGLLITLIFPVDPERQTGPPWPVTPEMYTEHLGDGFKLLRMEKVPENRSHKGREGKEYLALWERL